MLIYVDFVCYLLLTCCYFGKKVVMWCQQTIPIQVSIMINHHHRLENDNGTTIILGSTITMSATTTTTGWTTGFRDASDASQAPPSIFFYYLNALNSLHVQNGNGNHDNTSMTNGHHHHQYSTIHWQCEPPRGFKKKLLIFFSFISFENNDNVYGDDEKSLTHQRVLFIYLFTLASIPPGILIFYYYS